ncbi:DUF3891 family protein [Mesonia ostreae]|uniref:DUF3891 family protein n=1 Tax=Mesonia ostreae TaxID=861110 RepID=A0ABU2KK00_9FLAO|nr:DUF3891 family protein [Mesonia ostreae]MDT0295042.1 DUF3891 family protein [Mesonia ostreae]
MIVNKIKDGYVIIYQAAHGLLASKIASHLDKALRPKNWLDLQQAVNYHDDLQLSFSEKNHLSKNGIPLDFTNNKDQITDLITRMDRLTQQALRKSGLIFLMTIEHLNFLNQSRIPKSKMLRNFFEQQKVLQQEMMNIYQLTKDDVLEKYELLRFCDRLSLILCKNEIPVMGRELEVNTSIDGKKYFISGRKNGSLTVKPWIFEKEKFVLNIETRILNQANFKSESYFKNCIENALPVIQKFHFVK